jgi:hypothetical protein
MDENEITSGTTELDIDGTGCGTWRATNGFRWKQKEVSMLSGTAINIYELQQMWQSNNGEEKWEAVPYVD